MTDNNATQPPQPNVEAETPQPQADLDPATRELLRQALPKSFEGASPVYSADDFLVDVEAWVDNWSSHRDDAFRIKAASTFLGGPAKRWWSSLTTKPEKWDDFKSMLKRNFKPIDDAVLARTELLRLKFRSGDNLQAFIERFRGLMLRLPKMDSGDRVFFFTQALTAPLARAVARGMPTSIEEAINLAVFDQATFSSALERIEPPPLARRVDRPSFVPRTPQRPGRRDSLIVPPTPATPGPLYAELNALNKLTEEERQECLRTGRCFRCRQYGHRAADCPIAARATTTSRSFRRPDEPSDNDQ